MIFARQAGDIKQDFGFLRDQRQLFELPLVDSNRRARDFSEDWGRGRRAIVVAGATAGPNPPADLARVFWRQLRVLGSTMGSQPEFAALVRFIESARIAPIVDTVYPANDARTAFARLAAGDFTGKLALSFE